MSETNGNTTLTVLSASEIRKGWGKVKATVDRAFWSGKITGRRIDDRGTYIYDRASVVALWGAPKNARFMTDGE